MAIDKSAMNMQDVDLDDIEVVILIIAKNPAKIQQATNFLTRRGWPTTAMSNLSQAIEFATDRKPDFVLISINHQNPALQKFSDLLTNTFGTTCVAFAEILDNASNAKLGKSQITLKIPGQASGPNLHRSLRKILAEKLNIQIDDGKPQPKERAGMAGDSQTIIQKSEQGATHNKGATMIKGDGTQPPSENKFENESISTGKYTMSKKTRRTLKELSQNPLDQPGDVVMGQTKDIAAELKRSLFGDSAEAAEPAIAAEEGESSEMQAAEESQEDSGEFNSPQHNGLSAKGNFTQESGLPENGAGKLNSITQESTAASQGSMPGISQGKAHDSSAAYMPDHSGAAPAGGGRNVQPTRDGEQHGTNASAPSKAKKQKPAAAGTPQALLQLAAKTSLDKICRTGAGSPAPIGMIEHVGVFPVDSPTMPGYLVLAWPHGELRAIEPFFNQAQAIIEKTFVEIGIPAHLEKGFFVTLPEVEFSDWAADNAAFSFSMEHGEEEIGVAFFATAKPIPKPRPIEDKTMYSIDLENISTETPVTFKVYLHMKKNKKYFLYLRNGRQLQPEQKERLEGNQVKDLYMKTIDAENLRMFLATCYLTQKIKKAG